jgi:hypothetical protein
VFYDSRGGISLTMQDTINDNREMIDNNPINQNTYSIRHYPTQQGLEVFKVYDTLFALATQAFLTGIESHPIRFVTIRDFFDTLIFYWTMHRIQAIYSIDLAHPAGLPNNSIKTILEDDYTNDIFKIGKFGEYNYDYNGIQNIIQRCYTPALPSNHEIQAAVISYDSQNNLPNIKRIVDERHLIMLHHDILYFMNGVDSTYYELFVCNYEVNLEFMNKFRPRSFKAAFETRRDDPSSYWLPFCYSYNVNKNLTLQSIEQFMDYAMNPIQVTVIDETTVDLILSVLNKCLFIVTPVNVRNVMDALTEIIINNSLQPLTLNNIIVDVSNYVVLNCENINYFKKRVLHIGEHYNYTARFAGALNYNTITGIHTSVNIKYGIILPVIKSLSKINYNYSLQIISLFVKKTSSLIFNRENFDLTTLLEDADIKILIIEVINSTKPDYECTADVYDECFTVNIDEFINKIFERLRYPTEDDTETPFEIIKSDIVPNSTKIIKFSKNINDIYDSTIKNMFVTLNEDNFKTELDKIKNTKCSKSFYVIEIYEKGEGNPEALDAQMHIDIAAESNKGMTLNLPKLQDDIDVINKHGPIIKKNKARVHEISVAGEKVIMYLQ